MLLFYVRHGDPIYNPNQLTPLGLRQAEAIARRLARYGLDKVYCSSSNRAIQTAQPTCELLKLEPEILDWTNEDHAYEDQSMLNKDGERLWAFYIPEFVDFLTSKEIRDLGMNWTSHPRFQEADFARYASGHLRIRKDTLAFLDMLGFSYDDEKGQYLVKNYKEGTPAKERRIALFAHHGFGTNFIATLLQIPHPQICLKTNFGHTGLTVFDLPEDRPYAIPQMLTMGNDGHLLADNLPTHYNNCIYF